jgi:class 3 adenylate cyclase/alpha-beta hydrolase superfamily lysophospholipase
MGAVQDVPETRFARTHDGAHLAYQTVGEGENVVLIPGWATHIEGMWDEPRLAGFLGSVASFARLIVFDKRGVGLSDAMSASSHPTLEAWIDDVQAVMDAADAERAVLCAASEAGPMAMLYAATHPDRLSALVLVNTFATLHRSDDYPAGLPDRVRAWVLRGFAETAGDGPLLLDVQAPSVADDATFRRWAARYQRLTASPGGLSAMAEMLMDVDVRPVLGSVDVPTRVIHRRDDAYFRIGHARYLAASIPGAVLVPVPGDDHLFWVGDTEPIVSELAELLTGSRVAPDPDRVLSTVLFTDIVRSTERAAAAGDRTWTSTLDAHDRMVRRELARYRGTEIKSTGDGFLATFDGPARAIRGACSIRDGARELGVELRAGLHTGEIERRGADIGGIAVHIAARVEAAAAPGQVVVSGAVPPLVAGAGIDFGDLGEHELKGVPGSWRLFEVV